MVDTDRKQLRSTLESAQMFVRRYSNQLEDLSEMLDQADIAAYPDELDKEIADATSAIIMASAQLQLTQTQLSNLRKEILMH